jgi:hypothetical protein
MMPVVLGWGLLSNGLIDVHRFRCRYCTDVMGLDLEWNLSNNCL